MSYVLIADDEPNIRRFIRVHLERNGYSVQEAQNGNEAWRKLQGEEFNLLITDVLMPVMNGFALLEIMNSLEKTALMPVIVLGARACDAEITHETPAVLLELHRRGEIKQVIKPFNPNELIQTVQAILSGKSNKIVC